MKPYSMAADHRAPPAHRAHRGDERVVRVGLRLARPQAVGVGLGVAEAEGSALTRPRSNSSQGPSKSMSSRSRAEMRKWNAHFGHTERFLSTSLR